jgi:hypothetical protein
VLGARAASQINAVVTRDASAARAAAHAADERRARSESTGVLNGLPLTIKDSFETAGLRTTSGAEAPLCPQRITPHPGTHCPGEVRFVFDGEPARRRARCVRHCSPAPPFQGPHVHGVDRAPRPVQLTAGTELVEDSWRFGGTVTAAES